MKYILFVLLAMVSVTASAKTYKIKVTEEKEGTWICKVRAFTDEYEAVGSSKTEAHYKVRKQCMAKNNEMHCKDIKCEGEEPDGKGWVCSVSAFTDKYEEFGNSKTAATHKVTKECKEKHNEMHCRDVTCKTED